MDIYTGHKANGLWEKGLGCMQPCRCVLEGQIVGLDGMLQRDEAAQAPPNEWEDAMKPTLGVVCVVDLQL